MRRARRIALIAPAVAAALLLGAGPAAADVQVLPDHVDPGARNVTITFRVTNDDPALTTTRLQVWLPPPTQPLLGVTVPPPAGWTARLTTVTLPMPAPTSDGPVSEAVSAIEWEGGTVAGTEAVDFPVDVGLMPGGAGPVRFRAVQTYSTGAAVEWSDYWQYDRPQPAHSSLQLPLGTPTPPPPVTAAGHGHDHEAAGELPDRPAPGAVGWTVGLVTASAAALAAGLAALGRHQRRRFEALPVSDPRQAPRRPRSARDEDTHSSRSTGVARTLHGHAGRRHR
ncbi:DUF1775 domain-containing protein [Pseudonocardia sp. H11422]|uniref:DUF1775 domain-containing protein n=1 Tax=Pseudonocardia sp. H11422 TaxID=2835866 RepID=UPI001BDCCD63|nr:DUF1775 domain-containing protein [Pseudonocardia sp. H11422]